MKNTVKYKLILFIISFMFYGTSLLQAQFFNYTNYFVDNGFPQSDANFIMQDRDGYIWFASQNGVAKFDGFDYKIINNKNGLKSNLVSHILQDKTGGFWFSTKKGLTKYQNNNFRTYLKKDGLFSDIIIRTIELIDGRIIILTSKGVNVFENNSIHKISKNIRPISIIKRKSGEIYALTSIGIYIFKNNNFIKSNINIDNIQPPYLTFIEDNNENFWISTKNGLYYITKENIKFYNKKTGLLSGSIDDLLIDSENNLWYGSEETGCGLFKDNEFYNINKNSGLTNSSVLSLFEDKEKNIWIGGRIGATMLNTKNPFVHFDKISLSDNEIVMGMTSDKENNIWFCTYGNGITKYDGRGYTYYSKKDGSIGNHFFDIEQRDDGIFLLSSSNNGIIKFDGENFTKLLTNKGKEIKNRILTSYKDSKDNIWFGTNGAGVYFYNGKELISFNEKYNLKIKNVMSICEDAQNNIWISVIYDGLYKFDGKELIKIKTDFDISYVRTIVNRDGTLWLGTSSSGIFKVTENKEKYALTQYTKEDGLNSDNIYILFPDSKGYLWCGSEKGVDKIVFDKFNKIIDIKNYTKDEGFRGIETNTNAAVEDKDGNMWFGTVNGAVKYNEESDKVNTIENNTYLTGIRLFFEDCDWIKYTDSVDYNNIPHNLVLPYNQNHLTFDYIGLCFSNPQKVQFKYRLIGQNDKWSPPTYDRKAVFSNIAAGKYEFQVISANNDGVWNLRAVSFKFEVKPPVWKTIWFMTLILLLIIILMFFIINYRIKLLKTAKVTLEKRVDERTTELIVQKQELQLTNKKITDSIDYAGKIQNAMLPTEKIFENNFADYFILNQPRDIISGDFYWARVYMYKGSENIIVVAADCTGHGIPGALVSMLGMSLLNEIIRKEHITQTNQVLEELRKEIKLSLKQTGELDDQTEGIDMVICSINKDTLDMQYSGANSPMYIVRNKEVVVLKPTINPVGIFIKEIPFKNNIFQLKKGDVIYMFSDGYVDQFNGRTGEKFKVKRFRELLLSITNKPMIEQKQILQNSFLEWKADSDQIDDILILGLRI